MANEALEPASWQFRRSTIVATQALLRILHKSVDSYGADLEALVIYLAVSCATVERAFEDAEFAVRPPPPGPLEKRHYRTISRRAIAGSTGLPRETVRRKIAALVASGDLIIENGRVRIPTGVLLRPAHRDFAQTMIDEINAAAAKLSHIARDHGGSDPASGLLSH